MKYSKYYKKKIANNNHNLAWLNKLLLSIIVFLLVLIASNFSDSFRSEFKNEVLESNMEFYKFNNLYKKIIEDVPEDSQLVGNIVEINDIEEVNGRYKINCGIDYPVEVLKPGIIVFNGTKDDLGNTIIIQGNDGVDVWYSGVDLKEYSLYDYVSVGEVLGNSLDIFITISIYKDGDLLEYEEYI